MVKRGNFFPIVLTLIALLYACTNTIEPQTRAPHITGSSDREPPMPAACARAAEAVNKPDYVDVVADEAALIAMWWSGELTAPVTTSTLIADDLLRIRRTYAGEISAVACLRLAPDWTPSMLFVKDYSTNQCLEDALEVTKFEKHDILEDYSVLHFAGLKNPSRLADVFQAAGYETIINSPLGDWSRMSPRIGLQHRSYTFRWSWGDCPAGCTEHHVWYFHAATEVTFIGEWRTGEPEPPWLAEAKARRTPEQVPVPRPLTICGYSVP